MEIRGTTQIYGLIGNPVAHSVSPQLQNLFAEDAGLDMAYVTFPVADRDSVGRAVEGAFALGIGGLNVTVPYKGDVIPFVRAVDPMAERIGSVNTLVRTEGGYKGYNTDCGGFLGALRRKKIMLKDRDVVMIGAGGVARTIAFACAAEGTRSLTIFNRTARKAENLAEEVRRSVSGVKESENKQNEIRIQAGSLARLHALTVDLSKITVIQCTSAGLYPDTDVSPLDGICGADGFLRRTEFAFDVIYRPRETKFLRSVREAGGDTLDGLSMLVGQGAESFTLWTGVSIPDEEFDKAVNMLEEQL